MSGIIAAARGATCLVIIMLLLPQVRNTGVFEVQLTALINGWGLTQDGYCCSRHNHNRNQNHIRTVISSSDIDNKGNDDHSDNKLRDTDYSSSSRNTDAEDKKVVQEEGFGQPLFGFNVPRGNYRNNNNDNNHNDDVDNNDIRDEGRRSRLGLGSEPRITTRVRRRTQAQRSSLGGWGEEEEEKREEEEEEGEEEEESDCETECSTFVRVCLSHLQDPLPTSHTFTLAHRCTFGSAVSPVLGGNTLDPFGEWQERTPGEESVDPATAVAIPFTFSWPEAYTVVVEAWHDAYGNKSTEDGSQLIARAVQGGRLLPSPLWQNHSTTNTNTNTADLSFRFRVTCHRNYYGTGCHVLCKESDDPILGHYGCDVNGSRVCRAGWEGESCDRAECSDQCRAAHGFCEEPNRCRCQLGWRGILCSQCQTYPECQHGSCEEAWECQCHRGWSGSLCDIDNYYCERYRPCQNGGTCGHDRDALKNYTCSCSQGYGGVSCQDTVCYHGYCLNEGVCTMYERERFCRCRRGFQGSRCQHAEVTCGKLSCRNNGTCARAEDHFRCLCRPGFTGDLCETETDECASSPCKHGGTCQDRVNGYHCQCRAGHAGRNCDLALDPCVGFRCFNRGTCITLGEAFTPSCLCRPEFSGRRCGTTLDPCVGIACLHGGTCLRLRTTGKGASFHCACAHGYTGSVCQIPPPSLLCRDQPCLNGGKCRTLPGGAVMCDCLQGFHGALCESREEETTLVSTETASSSVSAQPERKGRYTEQEEEEEEGRVTEEEGGEGGGRTTDAGGGGGDGEEKNSPGNLQDPNSSSPRTLSGGSKRLVLALAVVSLTSVWFPLSAVKNCLYSPRRHRQGAACL